MPLYRYVCEECGYEKIEMRSVDDRDKPLGCEECGGEMRRAFSSSFAIEFATVTGYSKISLPGSSEPVYVRKHRNWTPPKEFLRKKMPPRTL